MFITIFHLQSTILHLLFTIFIYLFASLPICCLEDRKLCQAPLTTFAWAGRIWCLTILSPIPIIMPKTWLTFSTWLKGYAALYPLLSAPFEWAASRSPESAVRWRKVLVWRQMRALAEVLGRDGRAPQARWTTEKLRKWASGEPVILPTRNTGRREHLNCGSSLFPAR